MTGINFGYIGVAAVLALSTAGSAIGIGIAGSAAIGAWKRCYLKNKPAPFLLLAFVGAPLSQTIYGLIMISTFVTKVHTSDPYFLLAVGVIGGFAEGLSSVYQGKAAASACDAYAETGKGFANYIMVIGLVETVSLFIMVFFLIFS